MLQRALNSRQLGVTPAAGAAADLSTFMRACSICFASSGAAPCAEREADGAQADLQRDVWLHLGLLLWAHAAI